MRKHCIELDVIPEDTTWHVDMATRASEKIETSFHQTSTTSAPTGSTWSCNSAGHREFVDMKYHVDVSRPDIYDLIQRERVSRGVRKLQRSKALDSLAVVHALNMARSGVVSHSVSDLPALKWKLSSWRVGENVQRGGTVEQMHQSSIRAFPANKKNILAHQFTEFGVGIARDSDGLLYMCQYFRGSRAGHSMQTAH